MTVDEAGTALIVEVPAAELVVGRHRLDLDANARLGVPAHITILAPFMRRMAIGAAELARLSEVFAAVKAFDFRLDRVGWFETSVVWLGPQDPAPFRDLTSAVFAEFPDFPPFGGQFDDLAPHLTVGHDCPIDAMRRAEQEMTPNLPVTGRATAVTLLGESLPQRRWETLASFSLG